MANPLEKPVPPQGEEIHLPGGSLQPLALSVGLTLAIIGVTIFPPYLTIVGAVVSVSALYLWIRDARREYDHLPADHGHATQDHGSAELDTGHAGH